MTNLNNSTDGNKELRQPRIEEDKSDLEKLKSVIVITLTPFDNTIKKDVLFDVKTGKQLFAKST